MIITVTMNPAIDKTVEVNKLLPGGLNRIEKVEYDAGGKGINVSKTIRELGGESIATGFLGGSAGEMIESVLENKGIKHDFVRIKGETRTNMKVVEGNGEVTEFNEPGPEISKDQIGQLMGKLMGYARKGVLFILSGSIPKGVDPQIYARIIDLVHEKGAEVLLDADGALFRHALLAKPDMVKPNRMELEAYAGCGHGISVKELAVLARRLREDGIGTVLVSMGKEGALFLRGDDEIAAPGLDVKSHSSVGAGDAMVAALAYGWEKRMENEEMLRLSMAVSAGAVMTIGTKPPGRKLVDELIGQVVIRSQEKQV